jgi:hypothetical protein
MTRAGSPGRDEREVGGEAQLHQAWDQLLESLGRARDTVFGPRGATDDLERAEGVRFLTRLASAAFDMLVEYGEPDRPAFVRLMTEHRKFYGDNPDTDYDYAAVRGRHSYRISGTRGSSEYLACCVYGRDDAGATRIVANVSDRDMQIGADGRFELYLSLEPPSTPEVLWVPFAPDVDTIIMRQYFLDRSSEVPAEFSIDCLDSAPRAAAPASVPLGAAALARRVRATGTFVEKGAQFSAVAAHFLAGRPNELTIDSEAAQTATFYPTPDNKYVGGWFRLEDDEALVVEGIPPQARYWSVLLMSRWMESLDERSSSSINKRSMVLEADGSFRVVVAARDPGVPNWLDTDGHREGYVMFRWMQADNVRPPSFWVERLASIGGLRGPW